MIIDWFARQPFTRRHPQLSGLLCSLGMVVVLFILMPPLFWLLSGVLAPIFRVVAWWFLLWQDHP